MTITSKDIKKLADLARIDISDSEAENLTGEMDSILEYVGQIKDAGGSIQKIVPDLHNVMREDVATNTGGEYTEDLLNSAPSREGKYFKVKKIL